MGINEYGALLFLGVGGYQDWKKKHLSGGYLAFAGMAGLWLHLTGQAGWTEALALILKGLLPGGALLLLAAGTKESVGYGDGLSVLILSLYIGLWATLEVLCWGLLLAAAGAAVYWVRHNRDRKVRIAFLPFLFGGMLVHLLLGVT